MSNIFVFRQPPAGFINEYFGGGKGGSTTTTNNLTQIPPEVLARYNAVNARAETVAEQPYQAYSNDPNAFVAPLNATQQAGIQNTNIMAGAAQPYYQSATNQLMQAQEGAQPGINAAYQNVGQAQNVGNQYANAAAQQYGGAQNAAAPYYQAATQGLAAGLNYANPLNQAAAQAAGGAFGAAAPYYQAATQGTQAALQGAQPYQQAGTQAIAGATGAAQPYQIASTLGLGAALQGAQPFQNAAARGTQNALQAGQPYQSLATQAALVGGQAIDPNQLQTQQYMNPFTQSVVNATQAAMNQQQGQQLAQQQADAIKGGAFGGGRAAFQRAQLEGQQSLAQAQAIAPLYQQNYQQALAAAQQQQGVGLGAAQANRAATQQTGQQLAALGQQGFGQNLSAAQQMAALGQQGFNQQTNVAQQMAALGQQNYGQQLGAGQALLGAGQQTYGQQLGAANQMANLGQNLYGQGITGAQTLSQLGQTGYGQQLSASQQAQALGQGLYGQALGTGQAQAALGQQQYGQGQATAQQLAALAQQGYGMGAGTSAALAGLGTNAQQAGLAGAQAQLAAGQTQQQTQQAGLQALYNQFQQQQGFPYQQAQFLANIAEGTGALSGNATSGTSTTTGGGGFFSDERLKENIQKVGETNDGQPIYRYNYKGDKNTQIGLLAQDVEKKHPDAVGLAGGYKTVNYKKATEDAVHKADGGAAGDAYSMGAPSQMLQENSGKGLGAIATPTLPQMITGPQRIEAGANAADVAAMRAPKATGLSLGVPEAKQAELASLQSTLANPGPNANQLGSGPDYLQNRIGTLQDWLSKNAPSGTPYSAASSQGGLVSQPGNFAQGGFAGGRHGFYGDGYVNPALAYYSPQQGQQDLIKLQPAGQHGILQGQQMQAPQRKPEPNPIAEANQMASLALSGGKIYDWAKKPSTSGYNNDFVPGGDNKDAVIDLNTNPDVESIADLARGGVAGGRHPFKGNGYVNPYGSLGGNDILGPIIEQQDTSLRIPGDKGTPAPSSKSQQSGGLGELAQAAGMGEKAYKGANWAAGKLGLGEASPTAMSATSTEAIPGVAGGVVPEAVAPVVPEAVTAAAPEALTAGLAGAETVAAPVALAAGEGIADALPFLFFLKDGGAVPRRHFDGEDGSFVAPEDTVPVEDTTSSTRGDRENVTVVPKAPKTAPSEAPPRAREPGVAAASRPSFSMPDVGGLIPEGAKDTLSSENFWVPAIAGLGAMLASPNKTLAGAIGSGLVGGTTAYTGMEKQSADIAKQRIASLKDRFVGPTLVGGKMVYRDTWTGRNVDQSQYSDLASQHITGRMPSASTPAAVGTARDVIAEGAPKIERPAANTNQTTIVTPDQNGATAGSAKPLSEATLPKPGDVPPANAAAIGAAPAIAGNLIAMDQAMLDNEDLWKGLPPPMRPKALLNDATDMDGKIRRLEVNRDTIENSVGETPQSKAISAEIASLRTERQNKVALAQQQMARATELQKTAAIADINNKSAIATEAGKIELLPRKQQLELEGEVAKKGALNPIDLQQKQAEADIQRNREVQTAREKLPTEEDKKVFDLAADSGNAALKQAAAEAQAALAVKQNAQAALSRMFDPNGNLTVNAGPLGPKFAKIAEYMSQLGFSDKLVKDFLGTDPSIPGEVAKLKFALGSELGRLEMAGSPLRVTEFNKSMENTPNIEMLPKSFKWIIENAIIPKAQATIDAYKHVNGMVPGRDKIEQKLFEFSEGHPWFTGNTENAGEPTRRTSLPPPTPENLSIAAEERRRRDSLRRNP